MACTGADLTPGAACGDPTAEQLARLPFTRLLTLEALWDKGFLLSTSLPYCVQGEPGH